MPEPLVAMESLAQRVRIAFEESDLAAFGDLLAPDVHWGPPDAPSPPCKTREQVIAWYRRGRDSGVRARVSEVVVSGDRILVGLTVGASPAAAKGGDVDRWQVLTVGGGRVVDIVGFDERSDAAARAGLTQLSS